MRPDRPAGASPAPRTAVRLTEKKAPAEIDRALFRRTVSAFAEVSGVSVKTARRTVLAYASDHNDPELDGWSHWLKGHFYGIADPTGESARRRVDRERGGHHG